MPAISVVVPVYDVAGYLDECLDSILDQSFGDLEVIAVDDASTDGSGAILDRRAALDPRLRVVHLPANGGLGNARNTGLGLVTAPYLLFVDSDDSLVAGALEAIAARAAGGPDVVMFGFERTFPDGRAEPDPRSGALAPEATIAPAQRPELFEILPVAWNKAYRTDFAERFRFARGYYEDVPWTYPVLMSAASLATLDRVCYRYRQRGGGSILASSGRRHLEILDRYDEAFAWLDAHPEAEAWRGRLYDRMTRHVPTILATAHRIPPDVRAAFFARAAEAFRAHRPSGHRADTAAARLKIALIERGGFRAYDVAARGNTAARRVRRVVRENPGAAGIVARDVVLRARAGRRRVRARFADAWLLMDRDSAAGDNAEHLYRHLREHEPHVNAWFVLDPASPDWARLEKDGFRLLAHRSAEHYLALLNCVHLVSSQADSYVLKPFRKHLLGTPRWRFTFLQHGVIKDDLSGWLNGKPIDLFVTSTPDEYDSIVGAGSRYTFTGREVKLLGLARHDRLLALGGAAGRRELILAPTWRQYLLGDRGEGNARTLRADFWTSRFAAGWLALLRSDGLRALGEEAGWRISFLPHPNLQDYLDTAPLPGHVTAVRFTEVDVQRMLADAAVLVTDYSSLAFDAAYLERPVVYYQFDREEFFAGGHVYRAGRWSYEKQGFGPVTGTVDDAVSALRAIAGDGTAPEYAARMQETFPFRDGRCCERTVAAIRQIGAG